MIIEFEIKKFSSMKIEDGEKVSMTPGRQHLDCLGGWVFPRDNVIKRIL